MTEPVATYGNLRCWDNFGEYGFCTKLRVEQLRDLGAVALARSAPSCCCRGGDAAAADGRARRQRAGVAEWLDADPRVGWVRYAGLPAHPHHERARRSTCRRAPGAVFSFGVKGGRDAGRGFIESRRAVLSHLANVGDTRTLVIHPGSTTHQQLVRRAAGRRAASAPTWCGSASASRTSTTSSGTSTRR